MALRLIESMAWLHLVVAAAAPAHYWFLAPPAPNGSLLISGLFIAASAAIIYACRQRSAGTDLGHKVFPASLASYILVVLIAYRWWAQ